MALSSLREFVTRAGGVFSGLASYLTPPSIVLPAPALELTAPLSLFHNGAPLSLFHNGAPSCPLDGPSSCHNNTPVAGESCCFVHPGGRLLLTQFWDSKAHAGGAEEYWTLHGLWPDLCDGSYDQFCGMTPRYTNITEVLEQYGQHHMLRYMNQFWPAAYGPNFRLWEHEYNKHATCINTLAPACYGEAHAPGLEVVDYFARATALFRELDTHKALAKAGILPHKSRHYPLIDIQDALEKFSGGRVVLRCSGGGRRDVLHEAWYAYFVKGSLQTGIFIPAQDLGRERNAGNCVHWVRYLPKKPRYHEL